MWRFTAVPDIRKLLIGSFLAIPLAVIFLFYFDDRAHDYPRIAALITLGLFFVLLSVSRLLVMVTKTGDINGFLQASSRNNAEAFLIGSAKSLQDYIRDNVRDKNGIQYNVLGLIELEDDYQGRSIRGFPVIGNLDRLDKIYARYKKDKNHYPALVCVDANRTQKSRLVKIASEIGAPLLQINRNKGTSLSKFEVSDLIGRPVQNLDIDLVRRQIKGRRVLITGAGGSIGSEIARQIYRLNPSEIILVDNSEYNLYQVNRSLMNELWRRNKMELTISRCLR